jgi:hypothetical protein
MKKQDCPNTECTVSEPSDYIHWHEWARKKSKTHKQTKCPTCGLYTVWIPKVVRTTQSRLKSQQPHLHR